MGFREAREGFGRSEFRCAGWVVVISIPESLCTGI
jgi:hypothetical protein